MRDDWTLQQRRVQRAAAQENGQDTAAQAQVKASQRAKRAQERGEGVPAAERYTPNPSLLRDCGEEGGNEEDWRAAGAHAKRRRMRAMREAECAARSRWEECACGAWVDLGTASTQPCPACSAEVQRQVHDDLESWIECSTCGKWRTIAAEVLAEIEAQGPDMRWCCADLRAGTTCRSSASDWASVVRRASKQQRQQDRASAAVEELAQRFVRPGTLLGSSQRWVLQPLAMSSQLPEYVPGRDALLGAPVLAAGLDAFDADSGEHVLATMALPKQALNLASPFLLRALRMWQAGQLPECTDGRLSAGPVDLAAFLAQAPVQEAVQQALHRRRVRLGLPKPSQAKRAADEAGVPAAAAATDAQLLPHVVHVSPDSRKVYVGEEGDITKKGGSIMGFCKSWRSLPIRSWSGGAKVADMPGARRNCPVTSALSTLMATEEPGLIQAAELIWDVFAGHASTAAAAAAMLSRLEASPVAATSALGRTAWNAYSFNLDYRTGKHLDAKNTAGSYSALAVFETGAPFAGGLYMLPQFHIALDIRQGVLLVHRSGDAVAGTHGNSGLWLPEPASHRLSLVLYQTDLKQG